MAAFWLSFPRSNDLKRSLVVMARISAILRGRAIAFSPARSMSPPPAIAAASVPPRAIFSAVLSPSHARCSRARICLLSPASRVPATTARRTLAALVPISLFFLNLSFFFRADKENEKRKREMGSRGCQDLVDCIGRAGAMEPCAKFAPACTSQKVLTAGEEKAKLRHEGVTLELYGSYEQGVHIGRHEDTVYVVRRSAVNPNTGTMLVVPPSGGAYTVADMVFDDSGSSNGFSSWWRGATADEMTHYKCTDLATCLREAADVRECAEKARTCMRHAPRRGLCPLIDDKLLELEGTSIPLLDCWVGGVKLTHGSDESSFYITSTKSVGQTLRSTLLTVPRASSGAASTRGLSYKMSEGAMPGVYSIEGTAAPEPAPAPVTAAPPCSATLGACITGTGLVRCAERARTPCTVTNQDGGTLVYEGASIVLSSIGHDAYAADENNVYVIVSRSAELLVVPRRSDAKPTVVKVEYVSGVWRVSAASPLPLILVIAGACLLLLLLVALFRIATR